MALSMHHTTGHASAAKPRNDLLRRLQDMLAVARQRQALAELPAHLLRDIGVSTDSARHEASRAPWDVPAHWRG